MIFYRNRGAETIINIYIYINDIVYIIIASSQNYFTVEVPRKLELLSTKQNSELTE
jgi:hypothetical protein